MMYQTLGVLAGIALAFYAFLLLGRLGHYYADRSSWQFGRKYTLGLRLLLAIAAGIVCLDIWSAAAMVALHLAAFLSDTHYGTVQDKAVLQASIRQSNA